MRKFYIAVMTEEAGKWYAHAVVATHSDNLVSVLSRVKGLKAANICETKKQAQAVVDSWNSSFMCNGTYMFADSSF